MLRFYKILIVIAIYVFTVNASGFDFRSADQKNSLCSNILAKYFKPLTTKEIEKLLEPKTLRSDSVCLVSTEQCHPQTNNECWQALSVIVYSEKGNTPPRIHRFYVEKDTGHVSTEEPSWGRPLPVETEVDETDNGSAH